MQSVSWGTTQGHKEVRLTNTESQIYNLEDICVRIYYKWRFKEFFTQFEGLNVAEASGKYINICD